MGDIACCSEPSKSSKPSKPYDSFKGTFTGPLKKRFRNPKINDVRVLGASSCGPGVPKGGKEHAAASTQARVRDVLEQH